MTAPTTLLAIFALLAVGCAARGTASPALSVSGSQSATSIDARVTPPTPVIAPATPPPGPVAAVAITKDRGCAAYPSPGSVRRSSVLRGLEGGLGRWLSGVDVDRRIEQGRFRGWIIRRLYPDDPCYSALDLRVGDIVTRVNGRVPERPEHASDIFLGLRSAAAITVTYLRAGQPRSLTLTIVPE